jgi:hypothetical protein
MKAALRKNGVLYLLIGIPVASLLMGVITLYVAFTYRDHVVATEHPPLTKMSWQEERTRDDR